MPAKLEQKYCTSRFDLLSSGILKNDAAVVDMRMIIMKLRIQ